MGSAPVGWPDDIDLLQERSAVLPVWTKAVAYASGVSFSTRGALGFLAGLASVGIIAAVLVVTKSGASLEPDGRALARVDVESFGGSVRTVRAVGPSGKPITLREEDGRLTPASPVKAGEDIAVDVTVQRPHWTSWAIGKTKTEHLKVRTPSRSVTNRWVRTDQAGRAKVAFSGAVKRVTYLVGHQPVQKTLAAPLRSVAIPTQAPTGRLHISAAARTWEREPAPTTVTWFPSSGGPVAVADPVPGAQRGAAQPIKLTFSVPVSHALGATRPTLSPPTPGRWITVDSHTIEFRPTGYGAGFGAKVKVLLPRSIGVTALNTASIRPTREIDYRSPPGSTLRLQQLLAQGGYLPLDWKPAGDDVARTKAAESAAATQAPKGTFTWRYANTPSELRKQWTPGTVDAITRGAIMKFQNEHGLTADAIAGPEVFKALLDDAIAGKRIHDGYSYVYVHRDLPQKLTLWHNGHTVLTSPGNTGVPAAPTELGTFPVFEHLAVTTMSGTNPDGSTYHDPGIKWVSYFNGGDALHSFNRASFGTPQSLGCVELPLAQAAKLWPYTPIGTLVTIEH